MFNFRKLRSIVTVMALVLVAFLVFTPVVHAQGEEPPVEDVSIGKRDIRLEMAYQRQLMRLHRQAERLEGTGQFVTRIEGLITRLQERGVDTSAVEAALASFEAQVPVAQAHHSTAAGILAAHAGFNPAGKVIDPVAALETLRTAHESMDLSRDALKDVRQAIVDALRDIKGTLPDGKMKDQ